MGQVITLGMFEDTGFSTQKKDKPLRYIFQRNEGVSAKGIRNKSCKMKYIAFLDSDDFWLEKMEKQVSSLESQPTRYRLFTNEIWMRNGEGKRSIKA